MIQTTLRCPTCQRFIILDETLDGQWLAACTWCLENGEDFIPVPDGVGETPADAMAQWNERALDVRAPRLSDLATFIVPKAPEGYELSTPSTMYGPDITTRCSSLAIAEVGSNGTRHCPPTWINYGPTQGQKAVNQ